MSKTSPPGLGHAVALAEIPPDWAGLKILGRGATSIALARSATEAIVLTRDPIKAAWSLHALGGRDLGATRSRHPTLHLLTRLPLHRIAMPRYRPLGARAGAEVQGLIADHVALATRAWSKHRDRADQVRMVLRHYRETPGHRLHPLAEFLRRYRWFQADLDLRPPNFMQTRSGRIVVLDPVITTRLQTILERYAPTA